MNEKYHYHHPLLPFFKAMQGRFSIWIHVYMYVMYTGIPLFSSITLQKTADSCGNDFNDLTTPLMTACVEHTDSVHVSILRHSRCHHPLNVEGEKRPLLATAIQFILRSTMVAKCKPTCSSIYLGKLIW